MKKYILKTLFFVLIFSFGFLVWYSPIIFKGSAPYKIKEQIPLARSISETGLYSFENNQNVFLASSLVEKEGELSSVGNKFTAQLYAKVFNVFGVLNPNELVLFSIFLNSLALVIFAFIVYRLFSFKISALFSAVYALLPYNWLQVYSIGSYEFAVFFLSLFFLFFILALKSKYLGTYQSTYLKIFLILAGLFLVLSAMAREVFLLLIPILFGYFLYHKKKKELVYLFIPIVLILGIFYIPNFLGGNSYIDLFGEKRSEESFSDFSVYGHLYPDPYTYHFERESFLSGYNQKIKAAGFVESLKMKKVLANTGEKKIKMWERLILGDILFIGHLGYFVSLEEAGGPFVLFFAIIGFFFYLKKKDENLFKFFIFWFVGILFLLSYITLVSRTHMMDFSWAIPLLVSLGIFYLISKFDKKIILSSFLIFTLLYSIVLADHIVFGKVYDGKPEIERIENVSKSISEIADSNVIAVDIHTQNAVLLNYLSDKSIVVFKRSSIEKLIIEDKLTEVFEKYGVKYIYGYNKKLTEEIISSVEVEVIEVGEIKKEPVSFLKSFLLNIVR